MRLQGSNKDRVRHGEKEDVYVVQYAGVAISVTEQAKEEEEEEEAKRRKRQGQEHYLD